MDITEQIELTNIAKSLINQRVMFVCGAGMSIESEVPLFMYVVKEVLRRQFSVLNLPDGELEVKIEELSGKFNPEAIIAWYIASKPKPLQQDEIKKELTAILGDKYCKPNEGHRVLQRFFQSRLMNKIYTTNFEFLLEKCFGSAGKTVTDKNITQLKEIIKKGDIAVIHFHGHLEEDLAITEEKTFSIDTRCFDEFVYDFGDNDYVIFIGHSFNDQDIRQVIFQSKARAKKPIPEFVAVGKVDDPIEKVLAKGVWETRRFKFFSCGATEFLKNLEEALIIAKHEEAYNNLSDKLQVNTPTIREMAGKIEQTFEYFQEDDGLRYLARTFLGSELQ